MELGYRLRRSAWGKGYATEASRALIEKGFRELGVQRVFAFTMVVNTASRRVMEKAGLKFVRVVHQAWPVRIPGDEHGDVEYALARGEWTCELEPVSSGIAGLWVQAHGHERVVRARLIAAERLARHEAELGVQRAGRGKFVGGTGFQTDAAVPLPTSERHDVFDQRPAHAATRSTWLVCIDLSSA